MSQHVSNFSDPTFATQGNDSRRATASDGQSSHKPLTEQDIKDSLENDLLSLVGRMKTYARNYKD